MYMNLTPNFTIDSLFLCVQKKTKKKVYVAKF